jgi:hypothetical protein
LGVIYWDQLTWEAFATLAVGASTIAAATVIGLRQVGITAKQAAISERQSEILGKQIELDELKLRCDLFDRRFNVYEATRKLISAYVTHAAPASGEIRMIFLEQKDRANFLFTDAFNEYLQAIWAATCDYDATHGITTYAFQQEGHYGPELGQHHANLKAIVALGQELVSHFQTEMSLATLKPD